MCKTNDKKFSHTLMIQMCFGSKYREKNVKGFLQASFILDIVETKVVRVQGASPFHSCGTTIYSMGGNTVIDFAFKNEERKAVSNESKIITHIYYEKRHV